MIDRPLMQGWIQPQHLAEQSIAAYRLSFLEHPARLLWIQNFLQPDVAERLSRFLAAEADFQPECGLYSSDEPVTEDRWLAASPADRFFRLRKLTGTAREFRVSRNALTYVQFRQAFQRPEFKAFFEGISGLELGWSDDFGAHAMIQGDVLQAHTDDNRDRRLALVVYLSPAWKPEFGGLLEMVDNAGGSTTICPESDRLVVFDVLTDSRHRVSPIAAEAGAHARLSIGGWYHRANS